MRPGVTSLCAAALVGACLLPVATAQERTANEGARGALRVWPPSGKWQVLLIRLADGALGCVMATGHLNQQSGERYLWGLRWRKESFAATISDNNQQAVAGPAIKVSIDKVPVGTFQITRRISQSGFESIVAEFPKGDQQRIVSLIGVGGKLEFITEAATYSASLSGAKNALLQLRECNAEAGHLGSAQSQ